VPRMRKRVKLADRGGGREWTRGGAFLHFPDFSEAGRAVGATAESGQGEPSMRSRPSLARSRFGGLATLLASAAVANAEDVPPPPLPPPPPLQQPGAQLEPVENRYFQLPSYDRYGQRGRLNPFNVGEIGEYPIVGSTSLLDPYDVNVLKGDRPIWGENLFLRIDAVSATVYDRHDVAGDGKETDIKSDLFLSFDLQYGDTVFRPPTWRARVTLANDIRNADVVTKNQTENDDALQEAFGEVLLAEFDPHFDFISLRAGRQAFASDFQKFVFADANDGARLFGTWDKNRYQYDVAFFDLAKKDKFSNFDQTGNTRNQEIVTGDVFMQDAIWRGYTLEGTALYVADHDARNVDVLYLGFNGQGHVGRFEVSHALYEAVGHDASNPLAGRSVDVNGQMAALEVAYPVDWWKVIASGMYASGDSGTGNGSASGFDGVFDNPDFAGGAFGFWDRSNFVIGGQRLKNGNSLYPNLRTKNFDAPNFVNPGLLLLHAGWEGTLSNNWSVFADTLFLRFVNTSSLEQQFGTSVGSNIGLDLSLAAQYRPLGIDNVVFTSGVSALVPGGGMKDIAGSGTLLGFFVTATFAF